MPKLKHGKAGIGRRKKRSRESRKPSSPPTDHTYVSVSSVSSWPSPARDQQPTLANDESASVPASDLIEPPSVPGHLVELVSDLIEPPSDPDHPVELASDQIEPPSDPHHPVELVSNPIEPASDPDHPFERASDSIEPSPASDQEPAPANGESASEPAPSADQQGKEPMTLPHLKENVANYEDKFMEMSFTAVKTENSLHLFQFYERNTLYVKLCVTVHLDLTLTVCVHGKSIPTTHPVYNGKLKIDSVRELVDLIQSLASYVVCCGNHDAEYVEHFAHQGSAYLESICGAQYASTIRSQNCELLTQSATRCHHCSKCRKVLAKERRLKSQPSTSDLTNEQILSSSKPHKSMSMPELDSKMKALKAKNKHLEAQLKRQRAVDLTNEQAELNDEDANEVNELVQGCSSAVEKEWPDPNCFQRIFWEEQLKYNKLKSKSSMRWHPLIVKWALLIKTKSSKAYQTIKDFVNLPSERTLYDYSHCVDAKLGFQPEVLEKLIEECKVKGMYDVEWKSYVGILQDEIKIKDDLVFCPTTGQLLGFVNLDETGNQILELENTVVGKTSELATSALVIMVRGATTKLKFPIAMFATRALDHKFLHTTLMTAIDRLENDAGLRVLFITCDGANQNRKFFEMFRVSTDEQEPTHSMTNPFAPERNIYFISDVPHLLKTARNCFANSNSHRKSRLLWNNGKYIMWTHIVRLYQEHVENKLYSKVPLTRSHIDLTAFSQMKVNIAAQVLSKRVAEHLEADYGEDVKETVAFIRLMNKWFDILNTRHLYEATNAIMDDRAVFKSVNDERLEWLETTFLGYFAKWEESARNRPGNFSPKDIARMQLSRQTLNGFIITVRSIVACVRLLLQSGAEFVMTEVFNQDPLEQLFGHYRHKGGANDNPTIDSVRHTMATVSVAASAALAPLHGNMKRSGRELDDTFVHQKLARKKSRQSSS